MHELGIAEEMLRVALDHAVKHNAGRIIALHIEISAAADESEDALLFHFEHLTRGTLAEGARIAILRVPGQAQCLECGHVFAWMPEIALCPACSSPRVRALPHDEFKLTSIDVE